MEIKNIIELWVKKITELRTKTMDLCKQMVEFYGMAYVGFLFITIAAVPIKLFFFYKAIGISTNFFFVWFVSCVLTYLIFASFKNKWIPAVLFLFISFLMFADAAYASFFNRYLSINMLGAAGLLGGVQESVKEVVKPKFFALFYDAILIFMVLITRQIITKKAMKVQERIDIFSKPEEFQNTDDTKKNKAKKILSKSKHPLIAVLILAFILSEFGGSYILISLANQEFFSYHIRDIANKIFNQSQAMSVNESDIQISTGTYEKEKNGPLFGIAKGRNLIVIQVESLQNWVVDVTYNGQPITPNLNALIKGQSLYFDNYYEQRGAGNTSDAEYATNNSLMGSINSYTYGLFSNNYFRGLPWQLKENGYSTAAFHGYKKDFWSRATAYPGQGFDTFYSKENFKPTLITGMGIDDAAFFSQSIKYLQDMKQPFYGFFVTLSNHFPYLMPQKYIKIPLKDIDKGTIFGGYINSVHHTDYAIGQFLQELKDAGLYDNSIIAIYGDHFGLSPNDPEIDASLSNFLGKKYNFDTMMNVSLIINIPGIDINKTISISGGQLDFMPTIAYLLGLNKLDTLYFGHNLLTAKTGFVAEQAYMTKGSFFADDIIFEMSRDGVFTNSKAWNSKTGEAVPLKYCRSGYLKSKMIIDSSEVYLIKDILRKILLENQIKENPPDLN